MYQNQNNGKDLVKCYHGLVQQREVLEKYWKDAYKYTCPYKGQYFINKNTDGFQNANQARTQQNFIYDSTAPESVNLFASALISGLTPSSSQWFHFRISDVDFSLLSTESRTWIQKAAQTLFNMIHNSSNYNAVTYESFQDCGIAGYFGLYTTKEPGKDFVHEEWTPDTLYLKENPKTKKVDTVYRLIPYTISDAYQMFGNGLPKELLDAYKNNPHSDKMYDFIHVIKPREGIEPGVTADRKPIAALYVYLGDGTIVKESGYDEMPVAIVRWNKVPKTPYAVGIVNDALPDIKTLNKIVELKLTNADMAIAGTYVMKNDGIMNPNTVKVGARKIIVANDVDNIKPLTSAGDFKVTNETEVQLRSQIKKVMMADQLEPIQKNYVSATEVQQHAQIVRSLLAPQFGRLQSEFLEPYIARIFGLAMRDGTLGVLPDELIQIQAAMKEANKTFGLIPEYTSPMARAQRQEEINSMVQFEQNLGGTASLNLGVLDFYDFDKATIKKSELLGVPSSVIRSQADVDALRQQQAEQQAQAQQAQQEQEMSTNPAILKGGVDMAKAQMTGSK